MSDSLTNVEAGFKSLLSAASDCLSRRQHVAALILVYSATDIAASVEREPRVRVGDRFESWADAYVQPSVALGCTAAELYGARCGLLHTATAVSDKSARGDLREVYYSWGTAAADTLQRVSDRLRPNVVVVHIDSLIAAVRSAVERYMIEVRASTERTAQVQTRGAKWFRPTSKELVEDVDAQLRHGNP